MTILIRPDADISDGSWLTEAGGSTLYASIDETSSSDSDYIVSSTNPSNDSCEIRLSDPSGTPAEPAKVRYRYWRTGTAGNMELRVRLLQGATQIATWTHSAIGSTHTDVEQTLTGPEFASITDFTDLRLEFRANKTSTAWTPTDLGADLLRWYDASDVSMFTFSSGSDVATWLDKSGNGKTLTAGGTTPVRTASVQNGLSAVRVGNGGSKSDLINTGGASYTNPDAYVVTQVSVRRNDGDIILYGGGLSMDASLNIITGLWGVYSGGYVYANSSLSVGTTYLLETWGPGTGSGDGTFYLNGVADGTYNTVGEPTDDNLRVGHGYFTGLDGYVMEVIIANHLSGANRALLESYLMTKWGL